ncbi:hypothetical protein M2271_008263 [Streptomyces sp. LBL]|nr:hypothetical protein [Streptomyces sp. LBL]
MTVSGRRSGRLSVAGLIAMRPGARTRLCHRLIAHPAGKGKRRSMSERDFIALLDGTHQLIKAPVVLVWDRLNTHVSRTMRELIDAREWLTVFLLPAYSPDLNPVEGVWAHDKRSLANLAVVALDRLETLVGGRDLSQQSGDQSRAPEKQREPTPDATGGRPGPRALPARPRTDLSRAVSCVNPWVDARYQTRSQPAGRGRAAPRAASSSP